MATLTKELLGTGPFFTRDDQGNNIPSGREVYRIRVEAEEEFSDFHLRINMGRNLPGLNHVFGNNPNQIKILRPTSEDISQHALRDRGPRSRTWRGRYRDWNVPLVSAVRGSKNREIYLSFYAAECTPGPELVFDIVIADILQIREFWTTNCRRDVGAFNPEQATIVETGKTTEMAEREVTSGGRTRTLRERISTIPDHALNDESERDVKQAKKIIKSVLEEFRTELAFMAFKEAFEEHGYYVLIEEMPSYCDQNDNCFFNTPGLLDEDLQNN